MTVAPKITSTPNTVHLTKYPTIVSSYYLKIVDKEGNTQVKRIHRTNASTEAVKGSQTYDVITSSGKVHTFADEVTEAPKPLSKAEKARMITDLKAQFSAGTIDHQSFNDQIMILI